MPPAVIPNRSFRRALITLNGLGANPDLDGLQLPAAQPGADWVAAMIGFLGFVQVDTIAAVERAHHHILFTRNRQYRRRDLKQALEVDRSVFENWTHDHAILPVSSFPQWKYLFKRQADFSVHPGYRKYFEQADAAARRRVVSRIRKMGPLRPRDIDDRKAAFETTDAYFVQPLVAKIACEFLWRTGKLAVAARDSQAKVYDLIERVIPDEHRKTRLSRAATVDWACRNALLRLGAGTPAQVAHFFDLITTEDATAWCQRTSDVVSVRIETAQGTAGPEVFALKRLTTFLNDAPKVPGGLRLLNPFDPLLRDRKRALRVFGFDYTIEIFVPAKKRKYGYYVLPILEGDRLTGRTDVKVDRKAGTLNVLGLWWEPGVKETKARRAALDRAMAKLERFALAG